MSPRALDPSRRLARSRIAALALLLAPALASADELPQGETDSTIQILAHDPDKTWNGTTVFGDNDNQRIVEVNMEGQVVWEYVLSGSPPAVITGISVLANDHVLFAVVQPESRRGAFEVNRAGQIVWQFADRRVSHDAVRLPSGNTLITAAHSEDYSAWPYADPQVFEVDPSGTIVWSFAFKDVYQNDNAYKDIRTTDFGPWSHVNGALRLPDGNTLVSSRNFAMTIEVNPDGNVVETYGAGCTNCPSFVPANNTCALQARRPQCPHTPLLLPGGNILYSEPIPTSRVMEYNPTTKRIVWDYSQGTKAQGGEWMMVRAAQRLPNGNTLLTDSHGQILEVTQDERVVWKLRLSTYNRGGVEDAPFFQAERVSYMPPQIRVVTPTPESVYAGPFDVAITEIADVGTILYSVRNDDTGEFVTENETYLRNVYANALDPPHKDRGPARLDLPDGNYTFFVRANSTGWGYKDYLTPKRINVETTEHRFAVARATDPPIAEFTFTPAVPTEGEAVAFRDSSSGPVTSRRWSFGDGQTSAETNPTHRYEAPGSFEATLSVFDEAGRTDAHTRTVTVRAAPTEENATQPPARGDPNESAGDGREDPGAEGTRSETTRSPRRTPFSSAITVPAIVAIAALPWLRRTR